MSHSVRALVVLCVLLLSPLKMFGGWYGEEGSGGWTPTSCGLVLNFEQGDQFWLSVVIGGTEYFVCDYASYPNSPADDNPFGYTKGKNVLKLIKATGTEPPAGSLWTVGAPLERKFGGTDYSLGGIIYTMRSDEGQTLMTKSGSDYEYEGALALEDESPNNINSPKNALCDVVFAVPTNRSTDADPYHTLGHAGAFDGATGEGFNGMVYREVYWFHKGRKNGPECYTNTSLTAVDVDGGKGKIWQINAKDSGTGKSRKRTLFRIYSKNKPFTTCPSSFFFAWDVQDYVRYRKGPDTNQPSLTMSDSTAARKIYTSDHLYCMEESGETNCYQTADGFQIPPSDSTYFYVGRNDKYRSSREGVSLVSGGSAFSQFTSILKLRVRALAGKTGADTLYTPKAGAFGRMVIDTTTYADNLGVTFEPAGYFLRANSGLNIPMLPSPDGSYWQTENVWTITSALAGFTVKATLYTQSEFSETDKGADIRGWSTMVGLGDVPLISGGAIPSGTTGWARIYPNSADPNGGMVFVPADGNTYIRYHNNGHFGDTIPDQYAPTGDDKTLIVQAPRLLADYTFNGWNIAANGSGATYPAGATVDLATNPYVTIDGGKRVLHLYAKATYTGSINVAISFLKDGERYFIMQPGLAPRYARARRFGDWTNVWQGMGDVNNSLPNYLSTFELIGKPTCIECAPHEYVLDPSRHVMYGNTDSLVFYQDFQPENNEYLGLYYVAPYTLLSNNSWAGLFMSSNGWPTPVQPCIESTTISSSHYLDDLESGPGNFDYNQRPSDPLLAADTVLYYNATANQFNDTILSEGTEFMISGVGVVDAHYVILPDTTHAETQWVDSIVFDYHDNQQLTQTVWSSLIGKQLMAQMTIGDKIVYFHPNSDKMTTTASGLNLSLDYRLSQTFTYIPDARGGSLDTLSAAFRPTLTTVTENFSRLVTSGITSPREIKDAKGNYVDVCDTIRVRLVPRAGSKIKDYYGRWRTGSPGLHVASDGSRYRDIIVRTKTFHNGPKDSTLVLTPDREGYVLSPLKDQKQRLNFKLQKQVYHWLHELRGEEHIPVVKEIISTTDVTSGNLALTVDSCSFSSGKTSTYFSVYSAAYDSVVLQTRTDNTTENRVDTLIVSTPAKTIEGHTYPTFKTRIPIRQAKLAGDELIWSVVKDGVRYYITAGNGSSTPIFRQYSLNGSTLYQYGTTNQLIKGAEDGANGNNRYITPWKFTYTDRENQQLKLETEYGVERGFAIDGTTGIITTPASASSFKYEYVGINVNDNANFEEKVYLQCDADKWLKFTGSALETTTNKAEASVFYWGYLQTEYNLQNNGTYPNPSRLEFNNARTAKTVTTGYKAYRIYSMLLDSALVYLGKTERTAKTYLVNPEGEWKTAYSVTLKHDERWNDLPVGSRPSSGLTASPSETSFVTTVTPVGASPTDVTLGGKYVDIVDTLICELSLQDDAPEYRFKDKWSKFKSVSDANLKIPLICKTYHEVPYDSMECHVDGDKYNHTFPATIPLAGESVTFTFRTYHLTGSEMRDVSDNLISRHDTTIAGVLPGGGRWDLSDRALAELRLVDDYGNTPTWCTISGKTANTITVKCTHSGVRSPRTASLHIAYAVIEGGKMYFVNFEVTVSQPSFFQYANNQVLIHSAGASGDPLMEDGRQRAHENKRILYYYNPSPYNVYDQNVELPVRERGFYGWWRWYEETAGVDEADIPTAQWQTPPLNVGRYDYPYRIIGDSVPDPDNAGKKKLVTQGRYTVFHYPSSQYSGNSLHGEDITYSPKDDPPAKSPLVYPPADKRRGVTYVVDISNYYDNLPLSTQEGQKNQIDTSRLDTMKRIYEPTLSLREVFELRPWTEMADTLDNYKTSKDGPFTSDKYMEDHVVMAPIGHRLLLRTEQRYNYANLKAKGHSESLLGYYMHDDSWSTWPSGGKDTLIWCGGWDVDCLWYTYDPDEGTYEACPHPLTVGDDFLDVPALAGIPAGKDYVTKYYCLRARSVKTTKDGDDEDVDYEGDYWYNICRYIVTYHRPEKYGPLEETGTRGVKKALITNDEIEQTYEVLERLNFDYNKPGSDYTIYPHPLPWEDASYGYTYPVGPELPNNRYHAQKDFPGPGEYSLINKMKYVNDWWRAMEQHGGAENGYMLYCDGMSSAGQVAALQLKTVLCEGQKMYFSGYVGNISNQKSKANPNFTFTVQGSADSLTWKDITSYTTGDIPPSNNWYQIFFPINFKLKEGDASNFTHFRVRIYNMASTYDGNDFVIDDMCLFATKPPLIAYQANSTCVEKGENDSVTHVVIRVDYQGFADEDYKGAEICYAVDKIKGSDTTFIEMIDGYIDQEKHLHKSPATLDTIFGKVKMPPTSYTPESSDSIFTNFRELSAKFEATLAAHAENPAIKVFQKGYIFENIDDSIRPVLYIIHKAKMSPDCQYKVRMSLSYKELHSSICAMTSTLKVSNRMVLELNGEEHDNMENSDLCANTTYDVGLRVKGMQFADSIAPITINGTCMSDWLPGDTASCMTVYGYPYSVISTVLKDILRCEPKLMRNANQFASNLADVNHDVMRSVQTSEKATIYGTYTPEKGSEKDPYVILSNLVSRGLQLYQSKLTLSVMSGDSVQYVIFPIVGSGSDDVKEANVEICPEPLFLKLKPKASQVVPLIIGGTMRNTSDLSKSVVFVADSAAIASSGVSVHIDSISTLRKWHAINLLSTDDPNYREAVHSLNMVADKTDYVNGETMHITTAPGNNYSMRAGYNYTFGIVMKKSLGGALEEDGCPVGTIPFTISVVPYYLRWDPPTEFDNNWNDPNNWIGITQQNVPIQENARFAPRSNTMVVIPTLTDGRQYPVLTPIPTTTEDSVKQIGFEYNKCSGIRFTSGTALGKQQLLTYDSAIVDMSTPHGKWAFRAAPVKGMLSGDIFMANADLNWGNSPWEVGEFDAAGRNYTKGNASFWLSFYNRAITQKGKNSQGNDTTYTAGSEWSRVANGMTESLPAGLGWAVYTKTKSNKDAAIRLPKNDDVYYYYTPDGEKAAESYAHHDLRAMRTANAGGVSGAAGKLAFDAASFSFTITNGVKSPMFVFGNPTMAYIDIWGFIDDNKSTPALIDEFDYYDSEKGYTSVPKSIATAAGSANEITNQKLYLPPMHAIVLKVAVADSATSKAVTLNANRVVTAPVAGRGAPAAAPRRMVSGRSKGIMTVTAVNPADKICISRLLLGQGYNDAILDGEDAVLTTVNVSKFSSSTPSTPFNIYAQEGEYGLSIDLLDDILNVPISFYNSALPYEPVSYLWFTGVNNITGRLVLYDALTDTERPITDGICMQIETPETSHETRYYIRRPGYSADDPTTPTGTVQFSTNSEPVVKIIRNGHVLILRNGHVYTMFGQKVR